MQRKYIYVLFIILLLIVSCTRVDEVEPDVETLKSELQKNALDDQISLKEQQLETLRAEAQDLVDSLRSKELMLVIREAKLDSVENALQAWEEDLLQKELNQKKMRSTSYLVLFIGIVLLIFSLFILFRPKKTEPEKPVEKPFTKAEEKAEKKPGPAPKAGEKPAGESAPSVAVKEEPKDTGKTATPAKKETPKKKEPAKAKPVKKEPTAAKEEKPATRTKKPAAKKTTTKKPPAKDSGEK